MSWTRRGVLGTSLLASGAALVRRALGQEHQHGGGGGQVPAAPPRKGGGGYVPVITPNGVTLPYELKNGVKEFHLVAEEIEQEFAPGFRVKCWGYNGRTPGPTIEAVEGDRVRILVTNKLPEHTSVHWHGVILPNGMDGVGGLNQTHIKPGETFAYEYTLHQHGTQMYHPHADEMIQMALGMMGMFVIHPKEPEDPPVDRDFVLFPHEWAIHPSTMRPDPMIMTDFNTFTFNGKVFPATEPMVVRTGQRVRMRFGNLSMDSHPLHIHGHAFWVTGTDGGTIPPAARWPETTVNVAVGQTRTIEFVGNNPGDWAFHCHKPHHVMNAMGHDLPNPIGADLKAAEAKIQKLIPGYMAMGQDGMSKMTEHAKHMRGPRNTLPMMAGDGPFGPLEMGGMFTLIKIRDGITNYEDPGSYQQPPGTQASPVGGERQGQQPEGQGGQQEQGGHRGH